ncbi:unnamed protein product [Darwinula stevensoni]|uniref:Protein Wnt n=1 Tax=Darwinula stevensoni TaxID=69355 RepID=A0A7R8XA80_9CRUS|nr:unnamed protein product [Darwinula stevensoni]CAG0889965.1 unnamed protein product [Darwinula stevensoni]
MNMSGNRPIDRFSNPVRAIMNLDWCWILWMITAYFASVEASLGNWMYLGVSGVAPMMMNDAPAGNDLSSNSICSSIPGLVPDQVKLCESHPWAIESVSEGARRGIRECQEQFRYERWNCSTRRDHFDIFGYIMKRGSKETAFIYAVTSAGVVHAITEACSSGNLTDCSCDSSRRGHSTPQGWKWGGCSDDIEYGVELAESFVDASEKERLEKKRKKKGYTSPRAVMNLHNNDAGREAVTSLMKMRCRCHGVSGSCELKTCWRALPPFADVGKYLKKKYESAIQVLMFPLPLENSKIVVEPEASLSYIYIYIYIYENAAKGNP